MRHAFKYGKRFLKTNLNLIILNNFNEEKIFCTWHAKSPDADLDMFLMANLCSPDLGKPDCARFRLNPGCRNVTTLKKESDYVFPYAAYWLLGQPCFFF